IHPRPGALDAEQIRLGPAAISGQIGIGASGDDMLRIDGLKTLIEGGIQGKVMREPMMIVPGEQEDPEYRGITIMPRDTFKELSRLAAENGWRLGVHCSGDAAIDLLLDLWEEVDEKTPIAPLHWVLIHGLLALPEHFERINTLGVRVACQTAHVYTMGASMLKWWGPERTHRAAPIRTFMQNGIRVGGGSDGYVCEWNPSTLMGFDVTRKSKWAGVLGRNEAINREETLIYHTINAALISDDDDRQGSIEPGKLADLAVLSEDIMTCPANSIKGIKVLMTMVGGERVYKADNMKLLI
ncbi:MAG: amidohydrolase family protein, partial [Deltaproteobacteria bacterium]|nr:amidohydrolase family protein [Deltaproteobacteria bacterium]